MPNFDKYTIHMYGGPQGPSFASNPPIRARIELWSGNSGVGTINFYAGGTRIPEDVEYSGGKVDMQLPLSTSKSVVDMLRNEQPVQIY